MKQQVSRFTKRLMVCCLVQFFACLIFWLGAALKWFLLDGSFPYIVMVVLLISNIIMLVMAIMLDKFFFKEIKDYFTNLEALNGRLRSQRHEYLNEMQVVYGLLELEEYQDAMEYLKPIYADIAKTGKALKTSMPAVNALLQAKLTEANKQNIDFYIDVSSDLKTLGMEQWDTCRVLSNLIDNGMTAVHLLGEEKRKTVHVSFLENERETIFVVYNNGPVIPKEKQELIFKRGYTSKTAEGHGLGLDMVRTIVTENHGTIKVQSDERETSFEVRIPKSIAEK